MGSRRIEKLPIVDKDNSLTGLITMGDLEKAVLNPDATKRLSWKTAGVAAATTVGEQGFSRSKRLIESGVDILILDTAHGH